MMFQFDKQYSIQRTDYNTIIYLIIILGSQLHDSYSPASALTVSDLSTNTLYDFSANSVSTVPNKDTVRYLSIWTGD